MAVWMTTYKWAVTCDTNDLYQLSSTALSGKRHDLHIKLHRIMLVDTGKEHQQNCSGCGRTAHAMMSIAVLKLSESRDTCGSW